VSKPAANKTTGHQPVLVEGDILVGRDRRLVDIVLDHPTVCQRHAKLHRRGDQVVVSDLRSTYGTFVDGQRVRKETTLARGARLAIGPFQFLFDGKSLIPGSGGSGKLSICCAGVSRMVTDRVTGRPLTLLHDISLAVRPKELVCLIGPSGSGKSTLLAVLSGRSPPDGGKVVYGGRDLHAEFESLKHDLAVVPQREALHLALTVEQSLWYSAGLRLPSDTSTEELGDIVGGLLREVGLESRRSVRIRDLSGGQLKRISLANEIAHRPSLVFLDEVTSGLDELGDEDMMKLFRSLADNGRSVVCITHNTLNIERNAHVVVVLTPGGRLACIGNPVEVCRYFDVARLGDAYAALSKRQPADWEARFLRHSLHEQYIDSRMPESLRLEPARRGLGNFKSVSIRRPIRFTRQFRFLAGRIASLQVMDLKSLAATLGQAVFIGVMLSALFGDLRAAEDAATELMNCRNAAFLLLVSVFWLGCNNAASEVVKERLLFERERSVSVNAGTYYLAKLIVLGGLAIVQAMIVYGLMAAFCHFPRNSGMSGLAIQACTSAFVGLLGTFTGLAISTQARTQELAVRAVPIVLIPQIVLANVIASLDGWLLWVGRLLVSTFWSFQAFTSNVADFYRPDEDPAVLWPAASMLGLHCATLILVALHGLHRHAVGDGGVR
jgi:ABC-type multidrug transport system ATPase subunit